MGSAARLLSKESPILHPAISREFSVRRISGKISGVDAAKDPYVPVLIVGAGPVGLVLSFLLAKLGVQCAVIEKSMFFSQHPQAHFINNRSMELFRKWDDLAVEIQRLQPPVDSWRKFIYCTSLFGSILGSVDHVRPQDFEKILSPISVAHFSQYKLVKLLLEKLKDIGFQVCTINRVEGSLDRKIFMGHECIGVNDTGDNVIAGASFLKEDKTKQSYILCDILVGSDGASSSVRRLVGINLKGERDLQKLISVHFICRDLGQYLLHQRPGMLYFVFNPEGIGVFVSHDLNNGEFVLQMPYYPPQQKFEDFDSKVCEELIVKLVGKQLLDIKILEIKPWVMHAEVAEKFISCNGRVVLVGDAAHRFPPAGGFGMNTGIQDAHNLAWKIRALLSGVASPTILQTYELERRPVAIANTKLSVENFKSAMSVPSALGLDPNVANTVHQAINSNIGSILPYGIQRGLLEGIFSMGRAQLSDLLLNENNPIGSLRLARLRDIFEEGKSLRLQFPAEDLGFRYLEGALVAETCNEKGNDAESQRFRSASREYVPSTEPGSRLPHMQVRKLKATQDDVPFSTLDLIPADRLEFLLIIAPAKNSYRLARAAFEAAQSFCLSLKVCVIWPPNSSLDREKTSEMELKPWSENYVDVEEVRRTHSLSWWEMCGMADEGVILVRPDDHVAWRCSSAAVAAIPSPCSELERVFSLVLGKKKEPFVSTSCYST